VTRPRYSGIYESDLSHISLDYVASVDLIEPRYRTFEANQPVKLFAGALQVESDVGVLQGSGVIALTWLPTPTAILEAHLALPADGNNDAPLRKVIEVILEGEGIARGSIISSVAQSTFFDGLDLHLAVTLTDFWLGSGRMSRVVHFPALPEFVELEIFHQGQPQFLTRFPGRLGVAIGECEITLDSVYPFNQLELYSLSYAMPDFNNETEESEEHQDGKSRMDNLPLALFPGNGYTITHSGTLRSSSAQSVEVAEALTVLELLGWFLPLVRGSWSFPFLIVGEDAQGVRQWERLGPQRADPWNGEVSWWPRGGDREQLPWSSEEVQHALEGFIRRWSEPDSQDILKRAIIWYISACKTEDSGSAMVLIQAALELLAWQYLVIEEAMSPYGFDRLPAEDKIRLLLHWAQVPTTIPAELAVLSAWADVQQDKPDGVACTTQFRNRIVHPPRRTRSPRPYGQDREQREAQILALWYLELVLLRLIEYSGIYHNRVSEKDQLVP
jgi:hypothetical protein